MWSVTRNLKRASSKSIIQRLNRIVSARIGGVKDDVVEGNGGEEEGIWGEATVDEKVVHERGREVAVTVTVTVTVTVNVRFNVGGSGDLVAAELGG